MSKICYFFLLLSIPAWPQLNKTGEQRNMLADIPLSFEPTAGRSGSGVKFLSRRPGSTVSVSSTEVEVSGRGGSLRLKLVGGNRHARIEPLDPLPGITNYFIGNDPSKWRTGVPNYARIAVRGAYQGIDLIFYGNDRQLEYDAIVSPGADASRIRVKFSPSKNAKQDENGDVIVKAGAAELRLRKPVVYQMAEGKKRSVEGGYSLGRNGELAFRVGEYDAGKPLVIDPVVIYSTYLGATGDELCNGIAVDASGNAYVVGQTTSLNFPSTTPPPGGAGSFAFVTKIGAQGNLVYSTYFGGANASGAGIAVDSDGSAYVTGRTGDGFPVMNALQSTFGGGPVAPVFDAFVVKLNPQGNALVYSSYLGGGGNDFGLSIAVDSNRSAYVTGYTTGSFPLTNAIQGTFGGGGADAFVAKINPQGSALLYSTYLGGSGFDQGSGIATDSTATPTLRELRGAKDFLSRTHCNPFSEEATTFLLPRSTRREPPWSTQHIWAGPIAIRVLVSRWTQMTMYTWPGVQTDLDFLW